MENEKPATVKRYAVLSMDIEDWYHLDYFQRDRCNASVSLLDGVDRYLDILEEESVPSSFFVLGELAKAVCGRLTKHSDISTHGWTHQRPLTMTENDFRADMKRAKAVLEDQFAREVQGYRAPCFSFDRRRLDILREVGFVYDSSRIQFSSHPLYGTLDMSGFERLRPWIFGLNDFCEFEVSTIRFLRQTLPVSGGGYLRLLPWPLMRSMLSRYLKHESFFVLYIHPFELSLQSDPALPAGTPWPTRLRFSLGRNEVAHRLRQLIALVKFHGFVFSTFSEVRQELLSQQ